MTKRFLTSKYEHVQKLRHTCSLISFNFFADLTRIIWTLNGDSRQSTWYRRALAGVKNRNQMEITFPEHKDNCWQEQIQFQCRVLDYFTHWKNSFETDNTQTPTGIIGEEASTDILSDKMRLWNYTITFYTSDRNFGSWLMDTVSFQAQLRH